MAGLDGPFFVLEPFKTALELVCSQQPLKLSRGHLRSGNVRDTDGGAMELSVQRLQFSARNGNEIRRIYKGELGRGLKFRKAIDMQGVLHGLRRDASRTCLVQLLEEAAHQEFVLPPPFCFTRGFRGPITSPVHDVGCQGLGSHNNKDAAGKPGRGRRQCARKQGAAKMPRAVAGRGAGGGKA